jgi:hypothetical protein
MGSDSIDFSDRIYGPAFGGRTTDDRSIESELTRVSRTPPSGYCPFSKVSGKLGLAQPDPVSNFAGHTAINDDIRN